MTDGSDPITPRKYDDPGDMDPWAQSSGQNNMEVSNTLSDEMIAEAMALQSPTDSAKDYFDGRDDEGFYKDQDEDGFDRYSESDEYVSDTPKKKKPAPKKKATNTPASKSKSKGKGQRYHGSKQERSDLGAKNAREIDAISGIHKDWDLMNDGGDGGDGDDAEDDNSNVNPIPRRPTPPEGMGYTQTGQLVAKNGRVKGRQLVLWHRPRMIEKLMLHLQYEMHRRGIEVPWNEAVHRLSPGSSGQSATQHLNKIRDQLLTEGHLVPPLCGKVIQPQDPKIRGYIRDMGGESVVDSREVDWEEFIEDRRESIQNPGVIRGSGNYRKNPNGQGLDRTIKAGVKDGERRSRIPGGVPQSSGKKTKKRAIVENDDSDNDLEDETPSKRRSSARTNRNSSLRQQQVSANFTPSRASESRVAVLRGISSGTLSQFPAGEQGVLSNEDTPTKELDNDSSLDIKQDDDSGSEYNDELDSKTPARSRIRGRSVVRSLPNPPRPAGPDMFSRSPIAQPDFGQAAPRQRAPQNRKRVENQLFRQNTASIAAQLRMAKQAQTQAQDQAHRRASGFDAPTVNYQNLMRDAAPANAVFPQMVPQQVSASMGSMGQMSQMVAYGQRSAMPINFNNHGNQMYIPHPGMQNLYIGPNPGILQYSGNMNPAFRAPVASGPAARQEQMINAQAEINGNDGLPASLTPFRNANSNSYAHNQIMGGGAQDHSGEHPKVKTEQEKAGTGEDTKPNAKFLGDFPDPFGGDGNNFSGWGNSGSF